MIDKDIERDKNSTDSKDIERAITFLVESINASGHNPKPVILHSIKVGMLLLDYHYRKEIVIAGLLHDVLEDSDAKEREIRSLFGEVVTRIVKALTHEEGTRYDENRYLDVVQERIKAGMDVCIVDTADRIANLPYFHLAQHKELFDWLIKKGEITINSSKDLLKNELLFRKLENELAVVKKRGF
nr:HD domain-containing protein [Candidatus Sigynarchaeum springense]MDO8118620.1 HD domain-containing protein [Candidatus Sigynarchaeota archaeon]